MKLSTIFEKCLKVPYIRVENEADFAVLRDGDRAEIYFEPSKGAVDWSNNLDFPVKPYKRMDDCSWYAHRGFLKVWKSAEPYLATTVTDRNLKEVLIAGYSHGAALAVLCHEYFWFHRSDLRERMEGYGFGCPRVLWGRVPKGRWERFTVVRNLDDIVTHLPPAVMGYTHAGKLLEIGERGRYSAADAHRPENILEELKKYELLS